LSIGKKKKKRGVKSMMNPKRPNPKDRPKNILEENYKNAPNHKLLLKNQEFSPLMF
jgi:hypothetical protein